MNVDPDRNPFSSMKLQKVDINSASYKAEKAEVIKRIAAVKSMMTIDQNKISISGDLCMTLIDYLKNSEV